MQQWPIVVAAAATAVVVVVFVQQLDTKLMKGNWNGLIKTLITIRKKDMHAILSLHLLNIFSTFHHLIWN